MRYKKSFAHSKMWDVKRVCLYPLCARSRILLVLLSKMIPLPISLPYMELEHGVPTLLERPEVRQDVWLDPGMLRGEGASDERCWRIRFRFFTVWNTLFGCSLEKNDYRNIKLSLNISTLGRTNSLLFSPQMIPLLLNIWVIHLKFLPHGALYFCCQRVLEEKIKMFKKIPPQICMTETDHVHKYELTIGNSPREWKRLGVLSGRVLFLRFFSSSWASWSISMHSAYLSCNSLSWRKERQDRKKF